MKFISKLSLAVAFLCLTLAAQAQHPTRFEADGKYGFKNEKGKVVVKPTYKIAFPFREDGRALVKAENGKYGYINKKGKFVVKATMDEADAVAGLFCECAQPLVAVKDKMDAASDEEKANYAEEAMEVVASMMECMGGEDMMARIDAEMSEEEKENFSDAMTESMRKQCPDLTKTLEME